ncbi:2OG-Fe(II) oxygenase [Kordiimonas sp. A6E486]|nr:2OG-Fe(II) oxygenase [Kordiimonas marina]
MDLRARLQALDWQTLGTQLLERGFALTPPLLTPEECADLRALYDKDTGWRSHIHMARHNFGRGEYKYFAYPLPDRVQTLRETLYPPLSRVAQTWAERLGRNVRFPESHAEFAARCHAAGQLRPTPLMLKYKAGDYNCLHQDLYGDVYFPFQAALLLSQPGTDFDGGEFVLVENRPRMQSRSAVVPVRLGQMILFAVNERPNKGSRGYYRTALRHGVSDITAGERFTLGIIFHDAR